MAGILKIGFVGAGAINFGGAEGPWDHASRLEKIPSLKFVGIADPQTDVAQKVLDKRRSGPFGHLYSDCNLFSSVDDLVAQKTPDAVLVGVPPSVRGSPQRDMELKLIKAGVHIFVEKPMSVAPPDIFASYVTSIVEAQKQSSAIVSVGYMFRYHAAIRKMKEILKSHGKPVMALNARYIAAYEFMNHAFWWDVSRSGGPVVEQGTHFVDLARYLGGEIIQSSISTICTRPEHPAGNLSVLTKGMEDGVSEENRVPRATMATWRFQDGGVGTLMHGVALHKEKYDTAIDVIADGLRLTLEDIYDECKLYMRRGSTNSVTQVALPKGDDCYLTELSIFIDAVRTGVTDNIASTYQDAANTYLTTLAIRNAERN